MMLKSIGERAVVELDSTDCEMLAMACRMAVGHGAFDMNAVEASACFFTAAAAISRMHGWTNQPPYTQEKLDALCRRVEGE